MAFGILVMFEGTFYGRFHRGGSSAGKMQGFRKAVRGEGFLKIPIFLGMYNSVGGFYVGDGPELVPKP